MPLATTKPDRPVRTYDRPTCAGRWLMIPTPLGLPDWEAVRVVNVIPGRGNSHGSLLFWDEFQTLTVCAGPTCHENARWIPMSGLQE